MLSSCRCNPSLPLLVHHPQTKDVVLEALNGLDITRTRVQHTKILIGVLLFMIVRVFQRLDLMAFSSYLNRFFTLPAIMRTCLRTLLLPKTFRYALDFSSCCLTGSGCTYARCPPGSRRSKAILPGQELPRIGTMIAYAKQLLLEKRADRQRAAKDSPEDAGTAPHDVRAQLIVPKLEKKILQQHAAERLVHENAQKLAAGGVLNMRRGKSCSSTASTHAVWNLWSVCRAGPPHQSKKGSNSGPSGYNLQGCEGEDGVPGDKQSTLAGACPCTLLHMEGTRTAIKQQNGIQRNARTVLICVPHVCRGRAMQGRH